MSATDVRHARPGLLARLTRRAPAPRRPSVPASTPAAYLPGPPFAAGTPAREVPHGTATLERLYREAGQPPAPLPETDPWGPCDRPDGLLMDDRDLTDGRVAPRYVPTPPRRHSPDVAADLASLPVFRDAVTRRVRSSAGECLCGSPLAGQAWGERMVQAGMHLTGNEEAA